MKELLSYKKIIAISVLCITIILVGLSIRKNRFDVTVIYIDSSNSKLDKIENSN